MLDDDVMYVAGQYVPAAQAAVSALDAGLLRGVGLFETLRTYDGRPFRLQAHLSRLRSSARFFGMTLAEADEQIAEVIDRLLRENSVPDARVRLTATRGPSCLGGDDFHTPASATLLVTAASLTPYDPELYEQGATVVLSNIRTNETDPTVFHKTTGYLRNLLALREARDAGATEAILFNCKGHLTEGAVSNVFLVHGGRLLTPPIEEGLLPGVTRAIVLDLAEQMGIPAQQCTLVMRDILNADEMFLTNSIMEVMPVSRMEHREVGDGVPGPVTRRLAEAYKALVAAETGG